MPAREDVICGMLRAASWKFASGAGPSMIKALVKPSLAKLAFNDLVLASPRGFGHTMIAPSLALAERACLRASARSFFANHEHASARLGRKHVATRNCGTRAEPCRADPVPFCLYNFLPVRQMSARPNV